MVFGNIRSYENHGKLQYQFQIGCGKDRKIVSKRSLEEIRKLAVDFFEGRWTPPAPPATATPDSIPQPPEAPVVFMKTLGKICDEFLEMRRGKYNRGEIRHASHRDERTRLDFIKKTLGHMNLARITAQHLDNALEAEGICQVNLELSQLFRDPSALERQPGSCQVPPLKSSTIWP